MTVHVPRLLLGFLLMFGALTAASRIGGATATGQNGQNSIAGGAVAAPDAADVPHPVTAPPAPAPADNLHDPLAEPGGAMADVAAAKRAGGWALAVLAVLIMLTRVLARLPGSMGAWFATGVRATVVAGVAAVAIAAFNSLALGGTWVAVIFAAAGAAFALLHPVPAPVPSRSAISARS